jgi:hypothetical protein
MSMGSCVGQGQGRRCGMDAAVPISKMTVTTNGWWQHALATHFPGQFQMPDPRILDVEDVYRKGKGSNRQV